MSRARSSGHCAPRSEYVNRVFNDNGFHRGSSYCGEPMRFRIETGESEAERLERAELLADCPKCAAKWGKAKLAELAGRVSLEPVKPRNGWTRSSYALRIDGEIRGYVETENGWGKGWSLKQLPEGDSDYCRDVAGERTSYWHALNFPMGERRPVFWPIHYAARDAMAVAAFQARSEGSLPTQAESEARRAKRAAEREAEEEERAAAKARREAARLEAERVRAMDVELASEALESLRKRLELTNAEAMGLASLAILAGLETRESDNGSI